MQMAHLQHGRLIKELQRDANVKGCFHPNTAECDQTIIRAHSLQNNRIINKLADGGHVYMIRTEYTKDGHGLSLVKVGRGAATTFTGFCKKHDKEVFAPIEDKDYIVGNKEQEALFAFRALAREWHAKLVSYNSTTDPRVTAFNNEDIKYFAYGVKLGLDDLQREATSFKDVLMQKDYTKISTKILRIAGTPTVAVCSGITISHDFNGDPLPHFSESAHDWVNPNQLFLTVFPQGSETICLMSYVGSPEAEANFAFLDEQIINQPTEVQKERMSKLIISHCENTIFAPLMIEQMTAHGRAALEDEFTHSLISLTPENLLTTKAKIQLFN